MIKIFLGNSPWTKPGYYGVRAGSRWPHLEKETNRYAPFPFFLAYAAALLEQNGYRPDLVDGVAERIPLSVFMYKIERVSPDLIVMETSTPSFSVDLNVVKTIREQLGKQPKIALCGPNQLIMTKEFLESHPEVDFVFRGEYEYILLDLVKRLESKQTFDNISGLNYRNTSGQIIENETRPLIKNLDDLPWPSRYQLPMMAYYDEAGGIPQPSAQMWASRGCPYQCVFCVWPQLVYGGPNYRVRSPKDVVDEMEWLVSTYGYESVYFDDDTFNIGKDRMLSFCEELNKRNLNIPWAIMARADTMDREILEAMAQAGLYSVKYGVESADQTIVNNSGKNLDLSTVHDTVSITRELGIKMHLTFTFGLPGETRKTANATINLAKELNPDTIQFSICTPMPGSKYFQMLQDKGYLNDSDWDDYTGFNSAVARTDELTAHDLEEILLEANIAWYSHTQQQQPFKQRIKRVFRSIGNRFLSLSN